MPEDVQHDLGWCIRVITTCGSGRVSSKVIINITGVKLTLLLLMLGLHLGLYVGLLGLGASQGTLAFQGRGVVLLHGPHPSHLKPVH